MRFLRVLSVLAVGAACFAAGYFLRSAGSPVGSSGDGSAIVPSGEAGATPRSSQAKAGKGDAKATTRTLTVTRATPAVLAEPVRPTLPDSGHDDLERLFDIEEAGAASTSETIYVALPLPGAPPPTPPATPRDLESAPRRGAFSSESLASLGASLDRIFDAPAFENAIWGAAVRSSETNEDLYRRNDEKGFLPASNLKLYTTAAALAKLGWDFRYETKVYSTDAEMAGGVIHGDLYVLASGDPTFAARFHGGDTFQVFSDWARVLKEKGITRIEGDVVVDDDVFDNQPLPEGWGQEYMSEWYSAEVSGVALNDNCVSIHVTPGAKAGDPVRVRVLPAEGYVEPLVRATTSGSERGGSGITFARRADSNVVEVTGAMPLGAKAEEQRVTVHNPTGFFAYHLKRVMERAGISVVGKPLDVDDSPKSKRKVDGLTLLAEAQSPPLAVIVKTTQKESFNLYADHLLKTLGARKGRGGSFAEGARVVREFLQSNGVNPQGFEMADGSGLSRLNLVAPRQTLGLLQAMRKLPCFPYFYDSLPAAGRDGGGIGHVSTDATAGRLHAKTGYIRRVLAISGYVTDGDGETLVFSLMLNNHTAAAAAADHARTQVCELLAKFQGRRPAPPDADEASPSASRAPTPKVAVKKGGGTATSGAAGSSAKRKSSPSR